jgi:hypothetical protein
MQGISWLAEDLLASQEVLFSNELVNIIYFTVLGNEVTGDRKRLYEELHVLNFSPLTVRVIRSKRMKWG